MLKSLTNSASVAFLLFLITLSPSHAKEKEYYFSYTFEGNYLPQSGTWGEGAILAGTIKGTKVPGDPDLVVVHSFGPVSLSRPGLPVFDYDEIEPHEFGSSPFGAMPVLMSFSGDVLSFKACPGGFTEPGDCSFGHAPGGGFLIEHGNFARRSLATAADGSGAQVCPDDRRDHGCRVADIDVVPENWLLIRLKKKDKVLGSE